MIILPLDKLCPEYITAIATTMFNIEAGRWVFDETGKIKDPTAEFGGFEFQGVKYHIKGSYGTVILLCDENKTNASYIHSFDAYIWTELCILRRVYNKWSDDNKYRIPVFSPASHDFVSVNDLNRRTGQDTNIVSTLLSKRLKNKRFIWVLKKNDISTIYPDVKPAYRDINEFNLIIDTSQCLIVDIMGIFNLTQLTITSGIPKQDMFSVWSRVIDVPKIIYSTAFGGIDASIRNILNIQKIKIQYARVPIIYEEQWGNVCPMRVHSPIKPSLDELNNTYDFALNELGEVECVESGGVPRRIDVCVTCCIPLYGEIYVATKGDNYLCICAQCAHGVVFPNIDNTITILRVLYPRTAAEVIKSLPIDQTHIDILIDIDNYKTIQNTKGCVYDTIDSASYIGVATFADAIKYFNANKQMCKYVYLYEFIE